MQSKLCTLWKKNCIAEIDSIFNFLVEDIPNLKFIFSGGTLDTDPVGDGVAFSADWDPEILPRFINPLGLGVAPDKQEVDRDTGYSMSRQIIYL